MAEVWGKKDAQRPEIPKPPTDARIAVLAAHQDGPVAHAQLLALGLSSRAISRWRAAGRLHQVHPRVYAVGHPVLGVRGRRIAALLWCAPGAVLSHATAADVWRLRAASPEQHVSVTTTNDRRSRAGVRVHRGEALLPADVDRCDGLPVTSVARTLLDLAGALSVAALENAVDRAELLELFDLRALHDLLDRAHGRRGAGALRRAIGEQRPVTRSELERRFLRLVAAAGLPLPLTNVVLDAGGEPAEVDAVWARERVAVELDGFKTHRTRRAFEADRRRDVALQVAGWRTARFTWRAVQEKPSTVAASLRALLAPPRALSYHGRPQAVD